MEKSELLAFRVEPELAAKIKQAAAVQDRPYAWLIRKSIENYLQSPQNKSAEQSLTGHGAFIGTN